MKNSMFKDIRIAPPLGGHATNIILPIINRQLEPFQKSEEVDAFLSWNSSWPSIINIRNAVCCYPCFSCFIEGDADIPLLVVKTAVETTKAYNKTHVDQIILEKIILLLKTPLDDSTTSEICMTLFRLAKMYRQSHGIDDFTLLCDKVFSASLSHDIINILWSLLGGVTENTVSLILDSVRKDDIGALRQNCVSIYQQLKRMHPEQFSKLIPALAPYTHIIRSYLSPDQLSILNKILRLDVVSKLLDADLLRYLKELLRTDALGQRLRPEQLDLLNKVTLRIKDAQRSTH